MGNMEDGLHPGIDCDHNGAMQRLVSVDERKRITLGTMATHDQYLATTFEDGRIVFEPAVVVTTAEQRVADDLDFWARVAAASAEPATEVPAELLD
jgi:hypothetical protein